MAGILWPCPTATTETSLAKTKATTCSGPPKPDWLWLGKAPSPVCAGAQDVGADTATLRILARVQTRSSAHRGCRQKPVPAQTRGHRVWPTPAERALRTTVAGTRCYARVHGHPPRWLFALRHARGQRACTLWWTCAPPCGLGRTPRSLHPDVRSHSPPPHPKGFGACNPSSRRAGERWRLRARPG